MKLVILDAHAVNPGDVSWDIFKNYAQIEVYEKTPQDLVAQRIGDAEIVFLNKICITEEILQKCPSLKYIGVLATGYNVIDIEAVKKRGIVVTNIPAYSTESVSQHVFALLLNYTNLVALHDASVKNGDWVRSEHFCYWKKPLMELAGKKIGILGYGNIGKKVAEISKAFGMQPQILLHHPNGKVENSVDLDTFLSTSDIITLHAPLTEETKEFIRKKTISKMKDGVLIINTARGPLVNENDVSEALKSGKIAYYAADVIKEEPMKADSPLLTAPNCTITPHIAWAPLETRLRLLSIAEDNLKHWLSNDVINSIY